MTGSLGLPAPRLHVSKFVGIFKRRHVNYGAKLTYYKRDLINSRNSKSDNTSADGPHPEIYAHHSQETTHQQRCQACKIRYPSANTVVEYAKKVNAHWSTRIQRCQSNRRIDISVTHQVKLIGKAKWIYQRSSLNSISVCYGLRTHVDYDWRWHFRRIVFPAIVALFRGPRWVRLQWLCKIISCRFQNISPVYSVPNALTINTLSLARNFMVSLESF